MSDLISREAAIEALKVAEALSWAFGYHNVIGTIRELPTIDAVEVVRCKDCRYRYVDGENVRYNVCELNHNKVQSDDWYCADGERRDDER